MKSLGQQFRMLNVSGGCVPAPHVRLCVITANIDRIMMYDVYNHIIDEVSNRLTIGAILGEVG